MMEVDAMKDLEEEIEFESEQPNQEKMIITKSRGLPKLLRWSHAFRSDQFEVNCKQNYYCPFLLFFLIVCFLIFVR